MSAALILACCAFGSEVNSEKITAGWRAFSGQLIKESANPNLLPKEDKMNSLTIRIGWLIFVIYGLTCLVSLMHKNFVYW